MRIWHIPNGTQDYPSDDVGGDGDIAVNDITGVVKKKVDGAWTSNLSVPLIETTPDGLAEQVGLFLYSDVEGLTAITWNAEESTAGIDIESTSNITEISAPNLVRILTGGVLIISGNTGLLEVNLPLLESSARISINNNDSLESVSLPSAVTFGGSECNFSGSASLSTVSFPLWLPTNGSNVNFGNCALSAASVNHILARCVASSEFVSGVVATIGGTSAAPSGQGATDKTTLQGRGVTVNTN